jgi:hypothetical protein
MKAWRGRDGKRLVTLLLQDDVCVSGSQEIVTAGCRLHLYDPVVLDVHVEGPFVIVSARWAGLLRYAINHDSGTTAFTEVVTSPSELVQETIFVLPRVPILELDNGIDALMTPRTVDRRHHCVERTHQKPSTGNPIALRKFPSLRSFVTSPRPSL